MMRFQRIAAAVACALSLALPASAQLIGSGHVLGNATGSLAAPTDTPLINIMGQSGSGIGSGVPTILGVAAGGVGSIATIGGTLTNGHCVSINSSLQFVDAGGSCSIGSGGGTVNAGTAGNFAAYLTTGAAVSGTNGPASTDQWVNPNGSDSNSGLNPIFPKLTPAAALSALSSGGTLHVTGGMFTLAAALAPHPNTLINCDSGSGFTEANGANLATLIDFNTNTASGSGMRNCTVDGNFPNQTLTIGGNMINIGNAANITLFNNLIEQPAGIGVGIVNGTGANISSNHFFLGTYDNINITPTSPSTFLNYRITNNYSESLGAHFLELYGADHGIISGNVINGFTINGIVASITSSTTVSWVSGNNFSSLRAGNFIICGNAGNYQELFISSVNSATSLTIGSGTPGTVRSNQNCIAGPGDLMDIGGSFINIGDNVISGGTTGGIVVSNVNVFETIQQDHVHDNNISNLGNGCLFIEAVSDSGAIVLDNSYTGNHLSDCAQGQSPFTSKASIIMDDGAPTGILNQWIDGNVEIDNVSNTTFWMAVFGSVVQSEVAIGKNTSRGITFAGITGGLRGVTLSAGWGVGAAVNSGVSNGSSYKVVITSGTSGFSGSPSITINKAISGAENPPQLVCAFSTSNGSAANAAVSTTSVDQDVIILDGVPGSSVGYTLTCKS